MSENSHAVFCKEPQDIKMCSHVCCVHIVSAYVDYYSRVAGYLHRFWASKQEQLN